MSELKDPLGPYLVEWMTLREKMLTAFGDPMAMCCYLENQAGIMRRRVEYREKKAQGLEPAFLAMDRVVDSAGVKAGVVR